VPHRPNPAPHPPTSDDAQVEALVDAVLDAFTSGPGAAARVDGLRERLLPGAVIVVVAPGRTEVLDVDGFLAPRRDLLAGGRLQEFHEWRVDGRVEVRGDIAHWFGTYAKEGRLDGTWSSGGGTKSVTAVRRDGRWLVAALCWQDADPGDHRTAAT